MAVLLISVQEIWNTLQLLQLREQKNQNLSSAQASIALIHLRLKCATRAWDVSANFSWESGIRVGRFGGVFLRAMWTWRISWCRGLRSGAVWLTPDSAHKHAQRILGPFARERREKWCTSSAGRCKSPSMADAAGPYLPVLRTRPHFGWLLM